MALGLFRGAHHAMADELRRVCGIAKPLKGKTMRHEPDDPAEQWADEFRRLERNGMAVIPRDEWAQKLDDARREGWREGYEEKDRERAAMPEGWVPLRIEHEPGYPEDVAFGPQRMMDRLKKWLDRYFAFVLAERESLQAGLTNDGLREAWEKKVPGVEPTEQQLTAFALGAEAGFSRGRALDRQDWNRLHHVMNKAGLHPGRTDDDLIDILEKALTAPPLPGSEAPNPASDTPFDQAVYEYAKAVWHHDMAAMRQAYIGLRDLFAKQFVCDERIGRAMVLAYRELNEIRARDGVPRMYTGNLSSVAPEHFSSVVDGLDEAVRLLTGEGAHCHRLLYDKPAPIADTSDEACIAEIDAALKATGETP